MKECRKCKQIKPLSNFYKVSFKRAHTGDGHQARCKECIKAYHRTPKSRAIERQTRKAYRQTPHGKTKLREQERRYIQTEHGKEARRKANKKYYSTQKGKIANRKGQKNYHKTLKYKVAIEKYRDKFPEKRSASIVLNNAIASGTIIRPSTCSVCHKNCIPEGHHPSYSKPLKVIWLCKDCHTDYHRSFR